MPTSTTHRRPSKEKMARRVPRLSTYRGQGGAWNLTPQSIDGKPYFTILDVQRMLRSPAIRMGLAALYGALKKVKFKVTAKSRRVQAYLNAEVPRVWSRSLRQLCAYYKWGRVAGEVEYTTRGGRLRFRKLWDAHPLDALPLVYQAGPDRGRVAGVRVKGVLDQGRFGRSDGRRSGVAADLYPPYAFWFSGEGEHGRLWTTPRIAGAFDPWLESEARDGAKDARRLWFRKCAFDGPGMKYPNEDINIGTAESPRWVNAGDLAREIVEKIEVGASWTAPSDVDPETKTPKWDLVKPESRADVAGMRDYPKDLDEEMWLGMGIPPEVIRASDTSGSFAGRTIPAIAFYSSVDYDAGLMIEALDEMVIRPEVESNFGLKATDYDIEAVSLLEILQEEDGQGGPGGEMSSPGDGLAALLGGGQQQQQQPAAPEQPVQPEQQPEAEEEDDPFGPLDLSREQRTDKRGNPYCVEPGQGRVPCDDDAGEAGESAHAAHKAGDREDLRQHLSRMTIPQIKAFAKRIETEHPGARKKAHLINLILSPKPVKLPAQQAKKGIQVIPLSSLHTDPSRFQYKLKTSGEHGTTAELRNVKQYRPEFAGVILVWNDPDDGKDYVVNGHHRYELAERTGQQNMAVHYIQAEDAKSARAIGALANIAEGRGTAVDAAKFMRDMGIGADDFDREGVSLRGSIARDATALAGLSQNVFRRVIDETLSVPKAVAVGSILPDHDHQDQLIQYVEGLERKGKRVPVDVVAEMAREMASTPAKTETTASLFGDWESSRSLFLERARLKAAVRDALAREANAFKAVSSDEKAELLKRGENVINAGTNKQLAGEAERHLGAFDREANLSGPVNDAINRASEELADNPKALNAIRDRLLGEIRREIGANQ